VIQYPIGDNYFNKLAHQLSHLLRPTRYTMMTAVNNFNNPTLW